MLASKKRSSCYGLVDFFQLLAKFVNQHASVLRIVDRNRNEVNSTIFERSFERGKQVAGLFDLRSFCAITFGIFHEIWISERQAEIRKLIYSLFPTDHSIG